MTTLTLHEAVTSTALPPGTRVEVRRRFDRAWARGFVIDAADAEGYQLRRSSDGALLPVPFPAAEVRAAGNVW